MAQSQHFSVKSIFIDRKQAIWRKTKMTNSKHTPGPWIVEGTEQGRKIVTQDGEWIAQLWNKYEDDFVNHKANAALIAAAPDLLAAAQMALEIVERLTENSDLDTDFVTEAALRAAIRKAEGTNG